MVLERARQEGRIQEGMLADLGRRARTSSAREEAIKSIESVTHHRVGKIVYGQAELPSWRACDSVLPMVAREKRGRHTTAPRRAKNSVMQQHQCQGAAAWHAHAHDVARKVPCPCPATPASGARWGAALCVLRGYGARVFMRRRFPGTGGSLPPRHGKVAAGRPPERGLEAECRRPAAALACTRSPTTLGNRCCGSEEWAAAGGAVSGRRYAIARQGAGAIAARDTSVGIAGPWGTCCRLTGPALHSAHPRSTVLSHPAGYMS